LRASFMHPSRRIHMDTLHARGRPKATRHLTSVARRSARDGPMKEGTPMARFRTGPQAARRPSPLALAGLCGGLAMVLASAAAQVPAPASGSEMSDADRARRDAEKVFQWIRVHADKPRKAAAPAAVAAPATAA